MRRRTRRRDSAPVTHACCCLAPLLPPPPSPLPPPQGLQKKTPSPLPPVAVRESVMLRMWVERTGWAHGSSNLHAYNDGLHRMRTQSRAQSNHRCGVGWSSATTRQMLGKGWGGKGGGIQTNQGVPVPSRELRRRTHAVYRPARTHSHARARITHTSVATTHWLGAPAPSPSPSPPAPA
jgi:hypothetical protein